MSAKFPSTIAGFTVIPLEYDSTSTHFIYVRAHTSSKKGKAKDIGLPDGRTLFVVNVPPDATEREISLCFQSWGTIEKVVFAGDEVDENVQEESAGGESEEESEDEDGMQGIGEEDPSDVHPKKKRKIGKTTQAAPQIVPLPTLTTRVLRQTGRSAHVVFLDESSLVRGLAAAASSSKPRKWPRDASAPSGLQHYLAVYRSLRPPLDVVKAHANTWMEHFDWEQAKKKQQSKYKKGEAIVDDDGFTLVTRGGAYGQTVGGGVGVASKRFQREGPEGSKRSRKKKEPKEKDTFYAFQIHEQKRKELMDLQRKWEEDKAKVEKLKESRKFKPY